MKNSFQLSVFSYQLIKQLLTDNRQPITDNQSLTTDNRQPITDTAFTLVEILIVVTLIGLLATLAFSGYQTVIRSGRDALRRTDLEQIRSALEIYKSENSNYPASNNCQPTGLSSSYIDPYPADPKSPYAYCYINLNPLSYELCAHLENGTSDDSGCGSGLRCGANCNYEVRNP